MQEFQKERLAKRIAELVRDPIYRPMRAKDMAVLMGIPKQERRDFQSVLERLVSEDRIGLSVGGRYGRRENLTQEGVFHANPRGFGFVTIEGRERDVFIPAEQVHQAMDGDSVRVLLIREEESGTAEGQITQILTHANRSLVGTYRKNKTGGFVLPDNQKILRNIHIPQGRDLHAVSGHKVVAEITSYGDERSNPEGEITEILGHVSDPGVDILSIIRDSGIPERFPRDIMEAAAAVPETVPEEEIARRARHDFRALPTVTIDGEDAKDLDDAVSLQYDETRQIYTLYVHIADVSHYVAEHGLLDQEALNRGTSVYLVDRVIPMLPRALSNGICSLNEGEDRLALSCVMEIDGKGSILSHEICESVIRSDKRLSYHGVHALITGEECSNGERFTDYLPYRTLLQRMDSLSRLLRGRRRERGGIDFAFPETRFLLDEKGQVQDIFPYERNEAHEMIEDFMLAANETVAEDFFWQQLPFLYRVHEKPERERLQALAHAVGGFGHILRIRNSEQIHPRELQKLLSEIRGEPEEAVLKAMTLRSMKKARYATECIGHFGLAARYYTHFTSPIRRYPDLQIHRIIKEALRGGLRPKRIAHYERLLPAVADRSSMLERRAEEAEREVEKLKKCQYMSSRLGREYDGVISGVTAHGIYVGLPNTVEGMVPVREMDGDYYLFREETLELVGERSGRRYRLGDRVRVVVTNVDRLRRTIDFRLLPKEEK